MPAFIPLIATGISAGVSAYQQHKQNKLAKQQMAQQQATEAPLNQEMLMGSRQQRQQGSELYGYGKPLLQHAGSYYDTLLRGNRSALTGALAPEISAITDTSRGAQRSIERMAPGAGRDVATSELARQKAGQIGGAALAVRPQAAEAVAGLGQVGVSGGQAGGVNASSTGSSLLSALLGQQRFGFERLMYGNQQNEALGQNLAQLFTTAAQGYYNNKGPSTPAPIGYGKPQPISQLPGYYPAGSVRL